MIQNLPLIGEEDQQPSGSQDDQAIQLNSTHLPKDKNPRPFRLSSSLPVIPAKLSTKVQSLQFIELKEFLPDNIKLYKKLEAFDKSSLASVPPHLRPNFREISNLTTWLFCYAQYVAVLAEKHPDLVKSRLAYMCLIIH